MGKILILSYGIVAYLAFLVTILYAIGFVGNWIVPKSIDTGTTGPIGQSILINVVLLSLFAIQHTIMARPAFKTRWTKIIPKPIERSTFVLFASLLLLLLFWQWRPMPTVFWHFDNPVISTILQGLSLIGWLMVFVSSFLVDHFDLFGLRQVILHIRGKQYTHPRFVVRSLYRWIRHPIMAGFLIAFWFTPTMTGGHLLFAAVTSGYIFFGIWVEERDLAKFLGDDYAIYRQRTAMIFPLPKKMH